ncbi:MAG: tetratricopeptide repeat protein [Anaerolineaceae bacterium]
MGINHVIDVNEADFEYEVINYSQNIPVVVDFWAEWCIPCRTLEPILIKLVGEANGGFRLARVNVDHNPNLALKFGVHSIPAVKAISQGQVVGEFSSLQPERRIREFLAGIVPPSPITLAIEKADNLIEVYQWKNAEPVYLEVLTKQPEHPSALLGLIKIYLATQRSAKAQLLLREFPESRLYAKAELLRPLAKALSDFEKSALPEQQDMDYAFINCMRLVSRQNFEAALDGLLDIIKENRAYRSGIARAVYLGILELMGENNPLTRKYRSELTAALF